MSKGFLSILSTLINLFKLRWRKEVRIDPLLLLK
jgi:hypothetical protein